MSWLSPARRKAIYAALAGIGTVLVAGGILTQDVADTWVGLIDNVLGVTVLAFASYQARKVSWTALYGAVAAVVASLTAAGLLAEGQQARLLDVLAAATYVAPAIVAVLRTDPSTPTGEPVGEYVIDGEYGIEGA